MAEKNSAAGQAENISAPVFKTGPQRRGFCGGIADWVKNIKRGSMGNQGVDCDPANIREDLKVIPLTFGPKHDTLSPTIEKAVRRNSILISSASERGRSVQVPAERGRRPL